jgi:putative transcriptional regulator
VDDTSSNNVTIKWKLNQIMFEKGIKNRDLVEMTGLHPNTISKLKNSRLMPERLERNTLDKLCQALEIEPGDLLTYESDSENENSD